MSAVLGQLPAGLSDKHRQLRESCNSPLLYHALIARKSCHAVTPGTPERTPARIPSALTHLPRAETYLRDRSTCMWALNIDRQLPPGKSQRRSRLRGPACAEASKVLLPLNASADTCGMQWVGELGEEQQGGACTSGTGTARPYAFVRSYIYLVCVAGEESLLPGLNLQGYYNSVARVHHCGVVLSPQRLQDRDNNKRADEMAQR